MTIYKIKSAFYGYKTYYDITFNLFVLWRNNISYPEPICIQDSDEKRLAYSNYIDPEPGIEKIILLNCIIDNNIVEKIVNINEKVYITFDNLSYRDILFYDNFSNTMDKIRKLRSNIYIDSWDIIEVPEQIFIMTYLNKDDIVLEFGSNIGRSTIVAASILKNDENLVTLECDPVSYNILEENRKKYGFKFKTINAALSKYPLVQHGWRTYETLSMENSVNIIDLDSVKKYFSVPFNTLIVDCENAFTNILKEFPEIMENVTKVIIENDFFTVENLNYVTNILEKHGLKCVDRKSLEHQYHIYHIPDVIPRFYEVWMK